MKYEARRLALMALMLLLVSPVLLSGQVPWDAPSLHSPSQPGGIGVHFVSYGVEPRDGNGVLLTWRAPGQSTGLGVRGGVAEGAEETTAVFGGVDYSVAVSERSDDFPVDLAFLIGAGVAVGEYGLVSIPVGLSAGRAAQYGDAWVNPYLSGRIAFDRVFGGDAPDRDTELSVGLEAGVDLGVGEDPSVLLRLAIALGDRQSFGAGLAFPKLGLAR